MISNYPPATLGITAGSSDRYPCGYLQCSTWICRLSNIFVPVPIGLYVFGTRECW